MPLAVFDLDGTLFNNSVRAIRIFQEFAHAHALDHPELISAFQSLKSDGLPYLVKDIVATVGVTEPSVVKAIESFWFERFFTDAYMGFDLPTPGAVQVVQRLYSAGVVPVYLTGRDAPNMLQGTVAALQRDGFPIGTADTRIILKPDFHTPDTEYKASVVDHLRHQGDVVALFDNEPGICNLLSRAFPEAVGIWLDTHHAPGAPPLDDGILTIRDFAGMAQG
jgi:hypothetical protein